MTTFIKAIHDTKIMAKRNLLKSVRNPDTVLLNIAIPIMNMLTFVYVLGGAISTGNSNYTNYIVPSIILLCIGQCGSTTAVGISMDIEKGIIARFRSMPLAKSSVLTWHVLEAMIRTIFTVILILLVALLIGFRPSADITGWVIVTFLLLLFAFTITWVAVAFGLMVGSAEGAGAFIIFMMIFIYLSSGFVPTGTLPKVLRVFAENQPMTPIIESICALLLGTELNNNLVLTLVWCVGLLIVFYTLAIKLYKKKLNK